MRIDNQVFLLVLVALLCIPTAVNASQASMLDKYRYKVLKQAVPELSDKTLNLKLEEISKSSSKYNIDENFALSVIATEAGMRGLAGWRESCYEYTPKLIIMPGQKYPVLDYISMAVDSLRSSLDKARANKQPVEEAVRYYWCGEGSNRNTDNWDQYKRLVLEYTVILDKAAQSDSKNSKYIRDTKKFPIIDLADDDYLSSIKVMPNLYKQLRKFSNEDSYYRVVKKYNPRLTQEQALIITRSILTFSADNKIDPRLVIALIKTESSFRPDAVSRVGALGLAQLMPATAKSHGIRDPFDPVQNIYVCCKYLAREMKRWANYSDRLDRVLAAYNAGPGAVKRYNGVPPYKETQWYVPNVKRIYRQLID